MTDSRVLTGNMILSSLLGYCAAGASIASFIPLIFTNAVRRRSGTGSLFLFTWIVADVLNVVSIVLVGTQWSQKILAGWYCIADVTLLIELKFFGHEDWGAPNPKPASNLKHKRARAARANDPQLRGGRKQLAKWKVWLCQTFEHYSTWDDIKLLLGCLLLGVSWWGLYLTLSMYLHPDEPPIPIPMEISTIAMALGLGSSMMFALARLWEFISGWIRSKDNHKPEHSSGDPIFWFLILENVFNVTSIVTLSLDPRYLYAEIPWLLGAILPICFDVALLISIKCWEHKWNKANKDEPRDDHLQVQIDHVKATLYALIEKQEDLALEDAVGTAPPEAAVLGINPSLWARAKQPFKVASAKQRKAVYDTKKSDYDEYTEQFPVGYETEARKKKNEMGESLHLKRGGPVDYPGRDDETHAPHQHNETHDPPDDRAADENHSLRRQGSVANRQGSVANSATSVRHPSVANSARRSSVRSHRSQSNSVRRHSTREGNPES
ncbi:hypothetical protein JCM1840_005396 [Sporobolomyces johnsonii]